jgi:hypothetical protein
MRRVKLLWKKKWTQFMKASNFTKSPYTFVPLQARIWRVHVLLSSVMYIFSVENITAVFTISRRRWDQNATRVANRLDRARATYLWLLHVPPWDQWNEIENGNRKIILYWADWSSRGRTKISCTATTCPTNLPRKDPFHMYSLSPYLPQFQP